MFNRTTLFALVTLAIVSRLVPHPPNFAFVAALGLFAGCYSRGWACVGLPLLVMLISDSIGHLFGIGGLGFYHASAMLGVYAGIAASGLIGMTLRNRVRPGRVITAALASSLAFFLISNFAVWASGTLAYAASPAGLVACYTAALPFLQYTVAGDLFYVGLTFGTVVAGQTLRAVSPLAARAKVSL